MPLRDVARPDVTRYAHAIEVSILGAEAEELAGFQEEARQERGKFRIRRLANPEARPRSSTTSWITRAPPSADVRGTEARRRVQLEPSGADRGGEGLGGHPTFPAERFECPGGVYFNVGVTVIADEEFRPRRCLWSHPFARGENRHALFTTCRSGGSSAVTAGCTGSSRRERKGRAGHALGARRRPRPSARWSTRTATAGRRSSCRSAPRAGSVAREVEFAVSSPNYRDRHFLLRGRTRD